MKALIIFIIWVVLVGFMLIFNYACHKNDDEEEFENKIIVIKQGGNK